MDRITIELSPEQLSVITDVVTKERSEIGDIMAGGYDADGELPTYYKTLQDAEFILNQSAGETNE